MASTDGLASKWFANAAGDSVPTAATAGLLEDFANLLRPVAYDNPRLDVVPLLPFATWSAGGDLCHPVIFSLVYVPKPSSRQFHCMQTTLPTSQIWTAYC